MARQPSSISRKKKGAGICAVSLLCFWTLHATVGPTVVKVGDSELKKGEYALYSAKKFKKVTLLELGEKSKEAEPAKPEIDPEILAASKRTQAKSILKSNKSSGKQRLEAIVNEFEGTAAAKEAQKLLKEE